MARALKSPVLALCKHLAIVLKNLYNIIDRNRPDTPLNDAYRVGSFNSIAQFMVNTMSKQPIDLNNKTILVTGSPGFIGANLVLRLLKELTGGTVVSLDNMVYEDARKEFNLASKTGFGADGDKEQKESDFEQVRGDFESNDFVRSVLDHIKAKTELGESAVKALL